MKETRSLSTFCSLFIIRAFTTFINFIEVSRCGRPARASRFRQNDTNVLLRVMESTSKKSVTNITNMACDGKHSSKDHNSTWVPSAASCGDEGNKHCKQLGVRYKAQGY